MAAVIRSVKTLKEPMLLRRNAPKEAILASAFASPRAPREGEFFPEAVSAAAALRPQIAKISYEEYEQRFAAELDARRAEAREKGMLEGREAGLAKAMSEQASQLKALAAIVRCARERMDQGIEGLADLGAEIVFESVCKILGRPWPIGGRDRHGARSRAAHTGPKPSDPARKAPPTSK